MEVACRRLTLFAFCLGVNSGLTVSRAGTGEGLRLVTDSKGGYQVTVDGQTWLENSPSFITVSNKRFTTADGSLKLTKMGNETGQDVLGKWQAQVLYYQPAGLLITVQLTFKVYQDYPLVLFEQNFLDGVEGSSTGDANSVSTGFPRFKVGDGASVKLGYVSFGGIMFGDTKKKLGTWTNSTMGGGMQSGLDSGPLVLFDGKGGTMVVSPFREFMAMSVHYGSEQGQTSASWGLLGKAASVPKNFSVCTALFYSSSGFNQGMRDWGVMMRKYYNRNTSSRASDLSNNYIGYWTDNGAYYYYLTEKGKTYEDTMIDVKEYAENMKIPYRYVQYDSWWYYKGPNGGISEWVSRPDVFPHGMAYLYNKTGWPVVAHNRWWSHKTVYAKQNGGMYDFIIEEKNEKAIPVDQSFWDFLMESSKKWGLITYEQDWLNVEFDEMNVTVSNLTIGRQWLRQMGSAAQKSGINIQYCMAPSRHALETLEIPAVSQARVSGDYHPGQMQWKIGLSSMLADALGVAPFKDNYWTTSVQPGNPYHDKPTEPYPELNSLVSTLSTGPVGPSDMVGASNVELIMRSCNADGLILKPSKPATVVNDNVYKAAFESFGGEVWSTYSDINGWRFGIIMAVLENRSIYHLGPTAAGFGPKFQNSVVFARNNPAAFLGFSDSRQLMLFNCPMAGDNLCVYYTTPVMTAGNRQFVILGELAKWVPVSPNRVTKLTVSSGDIQVYLSGAPGETIVFSYRINDKLVQLKCAMSSAGTARIVLGTMKCISP